MNGPFGMKLDLYLYAKELGLNLDELVVSRWGKEDPFSKKSRFEILMARSGVTVEDLKNVERGEYGDPEDDYEAALKEASMVVGPPCLDDPYVDPCVKAKRFNIKLDWTDLPYIYPDDPWTIYPDPPDDPEEEEEEEGPALITPLATTTDAAADVDDTQMDDDGVPTDEDDISYCRRGCKRSNDGEIKKKDDDHVSTTPLATTAAAAAGSDKLQIMDDYQERGGGGG